MNAIKSRLWVLVLLIHVSCDDISDGSRALENFQAGLVKEVQRDYGFQALAVGLHFLLKLTMWICVFPQIVQQQ